MQDNPALQWVMLCNNTSVVLGWLRSPSGRRVQISFQTTSSQVHTYPLDVGGSALEEGSWYRCLLDTLLCWHVARRLPIKMGENALLYVRFKRMLCTAFLSWGNIVHKPCFLQKYILPQLIHFRNSCGLLI